jgi:hypothetical protein
MIKVTGMTKLEAIDSECGAVLLLFGSIDETVDICGIDDHHYLNFLFIATNNSNHSLIYDNHVYIRINSFGVIFILNCVYFNI